MKKLLIILFTAFFAFSHTAMAKYLDAKNIPEKKRTQAGLYLDSKDSHTLMQNEADNVLFIDVRTRAEVMFMGMPDVADANVPFKVMDKKYPWDEKRKKFILKPNADFVIGVDARLKQKGLTKNAKVLLMCRSGGRSAKAADALTAAGYKQVISVVDGFEGDIAKSGVRKGQRVVNGWINNDLPWSYKLDKSKMYLTGKAADREGKHSMMLKKMDKDKNGVISQEEFDKQHQMMFSKIDQNGDGKLDRIELADFKAARKQNMQKKNN